MNALERIILCRLARGTASGQELLDLCRNRKPWWVRASRDSVLRAIDGLCAMGLVIGILPPGMSYPMAVFVRLTYTSMRYSATFGRGLLSDREMSDAARAADKRADTGPKEFWR